MTQEEKARRYDEALERARQFSEHPLLEDSGNIVEYIFPELKESEDERIKKDLIGFFKDEEFLYHKKEEIVEWLEKQGEKPQGKTALKAINEEKVDNANKVDSIKLKEPDGYDDNIKWSDTDKLLMRLDKIVDCNIDQLKCLNNIFDKLNEIS